MRTVFGARNVLRMPIHWPMIVGEMEDNGTRPSSMRVLPSFEVSSGVMRLVTRPVSVANVDRFSPPRPDSQIENQSVRVIRPARGSV